MIFEVLITRTEVVSQSFYIEGDSRIEAGLSALVLARDVDFGKSKFAKHSIETCDQVKEFTRPITILKNKE
jgi:hypothetical protein